MLTMWNLVNHGARIIMSRILLDVDFNDQTTHDSANAGWVESYVLNNYNGLSYELVDTNDYCAVLTNYAGRGLTYTPAKFQDFTDYEIEFDIKETDYQSRRLFTARNGFSFGHNYSSKWLYLNIGDQSIEVYYENDYTNWHNWKIHRENDVLTVYRDNALVYTYDDTDGNGIIESNICFGGNQGSFNNRTVYVNNLKFTEIKTMPYILASSDNVNAGDTVTLVVNGDIQSQKWSYNNLTTQSIVIQPQSTITISCTVITTWNEKITLYKTINVSAGVVYGQGAISDDTLFLMNFANGKMQVLKGTCVDRKAIDDPVYYHIENIDGVYCCGMIPDSSFDTRYSYFPPVFDSEGIWYNENKPIELTFEYTIYTPNCDDNEMYWKALSFFDAILNTSTIQPDRTTVINHGYINLRGYQEGSPVGMNLIISDEMRDRSKPIYSNGERLPQLAKAIIGDGWSDYGWHHICFELHLAVLDANNDEISIKMYVDGIPIKTWHQVYSTDYVARNGEWFLIGDSFNSNLQWYISEVIITKGIKYGGMFKLPSNFYKQYTTIATEVLPVQPTSKFNDLAVVNANGTDAPVMAIIIESESLATPICFAQSYHDFSARDHNQELRDFVASGIQINLPERNNQSGNALSFGVASVNGEVIELSNQVLDGAYPAYLTVLEYLPFDTSQEFDSDTAFSPIYSLTLFVTSCQVTTKGATITAGWHDTLNAKFPFKRYTAKQFKGLRYVC